MAGVHGKSMKRHETEEEFIKRRVKELSSTETVDRMKKSLEEGVRRSLWHIKLQESLQMAMNSSNHSETKPYLEIFEEIGGENISHLNIDLEGNYNMPCHSFRNVVAQTIQTPKIMPQKDLKNKVFSDWDAITKE